jgi:hypothetical protein
MANPDGSKMDSPTAEREMTEIGEWLHPFMGRNLSEAYNLNFLWRAGSLYVMDNHRAALWCWWQHLDESSAWNLLHVDYHTDALSSNLHRWLQHLPPRDASLNTYLEHSYRADGHTFPVFSWQNYLSIFLATDGKLLDRVLFATAGEGDPPRHEALENIDSWRLLEELQAIAAAPNTRGTSPWIVNIDLDYFTAEIEKNHSQIRVFDDAYVSALGVALAEGLRRQHIRIATVALSPETTGGWHMAEELMRILLEPCGAHPDLTEPIRQPLHPRL